MMNDINNPPTSCKIMKIAMLIIRAFFCETKLLPFVKKLAILVVIGFITESRVSQIWEELFLLINRAIKRIAIITVNKPKSETTIDQIIEINAAIKPPT